MKLPRHTIILTFIFSGTPFLNAGILEVPADRPTIQEGIDAATDGDTVLVAPGEYFEEIVIEGKKVILGSWFLTTGDESYITQTIVDGNGETIFTVKGSTDPGTVITGLTIRNGRDGIKTRAKINILNNHISTCEDAVDYEKGSGGVCRFNVIENNQGEGLDFDRDVNIVIGDNIIRNNGEDGIEIQLNEYDEELLTYVIRRNQIYGNVQDGIQLVGHPGPSNRVFYIERNLIYNNGFVGLGMTGEANDKETFEGASIPDPIYLINNTFINNDHGVSGGDNVVALNNIIAGSARVGMKNVDENSIVAHGVLWANWVDFDNCNVDGESIMFEAPLLDEKYVSTSASPGVDNGIAFFVWEGDTILNTHDFIGSAPDIGTFEFNPTGDPIELSLSSDAEPGQVELFWRSNSASNPVGFEIQRSVGGIQLLKFVLVDAERASSTSGRYHYLDAGTPPGLEPDLYYYRIKQFGSDGETSLSNLTVAELPGPNIHELPPNYPNPFNSETSMEYRLPSAGYVVLKIYNILGQEVLTLVDEERPGGFHVLNWDGRDSSGREVASGVYIYRLRVDENFVASRRLLLVR
ncbi:T9SS type A sorting domain-containing protein [candidate division KSB1 bacterium]|nr:T9SS type A sorting domain-containing protein [candidate division KSB1 bacterium]NIR68368.1 T9SS type A sorting domain-containing protein [candidate division KSB1 bacterium]NIS25312.1 T9SS type A sorting domain-containing protein [candidate division KSB1 bacterium]NIT72223.1 T9SS type A sorting domain-containing protein [candidate division KSB1 bacterium]NIU26031.1 T9SS type A sorting domain-containing protein [candidate division KSB1 bacterium]